MSYYESFIYDTASSSFTITENECRCPTKFRRAFLMNHVAVPSGSIFYTHDAVIIYFICLRCNSKFSYTFDFTDKGARHRPGYYQRICYLEKSTKLWLARDEMAPLINEFMFGPEKFSFLFYNCENFAIQFYNAIRKLDKRFNA